MKRALLVLALALLLASCVGAADKITFYENDTLIQYDSVNFTIPHGFGQDPSVQNETTIFFVNDKNDTINITVGSKLSKGNYTMFGSDMGYLNQTNSSFTFSYVSNGKNVTVAATSQQILLKVLEG